MGETLDGVPLDLEVVLAAGEDVAEQLIGLRVFADVLGSHGGEIVHVALVDAAAAECLHDGVQRLVASGVVEVVQNGAIDPAVIVDEHGLGALDKGLVLIHVQHHEEVISGGTIEVVPARHLHRLDQQFVCGGKGILTVGIVAQPTPQCPGRVGDLKPARGGL